MGKDESKPKHRLIKKTVTVRDKVGQKPTTQGKPGRLQGVKHRIATPFMFVGRKLAGLKRFKVLRVIGYILVPPYFRRSFRELQQVTWPNRRETMQLTFAVTLFATVFGLLITLVDYGLGKLFKEVLLK